MKRGLQLCLLAMLIFIWPVSVRAGESAELTCRENRSSCRLLQLVMLGSFDVYDPEDSLSGRVLSAVYPQLAAVTEEDLSHYLEEFQGEEAEVTARLRIALTNCLWASLNSEPVAGTTFSRVRQILLLFLSPPEQEKEKLERDEIREGMTGDMLLLMADTLGAPEELIRWLVEEPDWEEHLGAADKEG